MANVKRENNTRGKNEPTKKDRAALLREKKNKECEAAIRQNNNKRPIIEDRDETTSFADEWKKLKEDTIHDIIGIISAHNKNEDKDDHKSKCRGEENGELQGSDSDTYPETANEEIQRLEKEGKGKEIKDLRKYDEIVAENDYLGKRVVELLALVAEMENEKKKTKELDEDWICSLIAERDEQCELKRRYMEQLEECKKKIKELEEAERDKQLENKRSYMAQLEEYQVRIRKLEEERNVEKEIEDINETVSEPTRPENKIKTSVGAPSKTPSCDSGISMNMETVNNKFASLQRVLETKIEKMIDDKLIQKQSRNQYAVGIPKPPSQTQQGIPEQRLDKEREKNVIIHGLLEGEELTDKERIDEIFQTTKTAQSQLTFFRLGSKKLGSSRPIMVRMQTIADKEEFMSKLWMLKRLQKKNLSITNDYSVDERKKIKEYAEEAKKRNNSDMNGYKWKVRGTPREGMKLIKIALHV